MEKSRNIVCEIIGYEPTFIRTNPFLTSVLRSSLDICFLTPMWEPLYQFHNHCKGNLRGGKYGVQYASGLSFQNQLMILGGIRRREEPADNPLSNSLIFYEDSGESKLLRDMAFVYYFRPQMILVDSTFC